MQYRVIFCLFFLFLSLCIGLNSKAQSSVELMGMANDLYQKGELEEALRMYQEVEKQGYESAQLYYNMGTTWFKLKHLKDYLPQSILAFERGLRISPKNPQLQNNLDFAKGDISFRADTYPDIFYKRYLKNTVKSLAAWQWLALGALFSWLIFWMFYRFLYNRKRAFFFGGIALTLLALFCLIASLTKNQWETQRNHAILFGEVHPVKEAPAAGSQTQFKLSAGNKLKIGEEIEGWTKVYLEDGKEGWVETKFLVII